MILQCCPLEIARPMFPITLLSSCLNLLSLISISFNLGRLYKNLQNRILLNIVFGSVGSVSDSEVLWFHHPLYPFPLNEGLGQESLIDLISGA